MKNRSPLLPTEQRALFTIFYFAFCIFLIGFLLDGCASPGEPYARKPPVPQAVADLAVAQTGNSVVLTFTLPKEMPDHRPLNRTPGIDVYRDFRPPAAPGEPPPPAPAHPTLLVTIPAAMVDQYEDRGHIRYVDALRPDDFTKHPDGLAVYMVRTFASEKEPSADSNRAGVPIFPVPDPIADLQGQMTHAGVVLRWTAPQKTPVGPAPAIAAYRIYRADALVPANTPVSADEGKPAAPLVRIGETVASSTQFSDPQFDLGKKYIYSVRSVVKYSDAMLESDDSNLVLLTPRDTFPPAAPEGLVVVLLPAQAGVPAHWELSWAISPETDIAGYNVYRSEQVAASGTRLNSELLLTPSFRDMNVLPGHSYFYSVTAVDRSGNESLRSAAVSGEVPAEGK
jgi:hypothetical protein